MKRRLWVIIIVSFLIATIIFLAFINRKAFISQRKGNAALSRLLYEAQELQARGQLLAARGVYQKLISDFTSSPETINWQKEIEALNLKLLFSPQITAGSKSYEIKPGDSLAKIAKDFHTTVELLKASNNLSEDKIIPGRKIKVWAAAFAILVDKSQNVLILKTNEEVFKTYIVSTGKNNSTPVGNFKITSKIPNPTWFKPGEVVESGDPKNILGTRWLGLDLPGYGIHGTTDPQSLGKQVTQGCVRMSNSDVEELYTLIPLGIEVTIVD